MNRNQKCRVTRKQISSPWCVSHLRDSGPAVRLNALLQHVDLAVESSRIPFRAAEQFPRLRAEIVDAVAVVLCSGYGMSRGKGQFCPMRCRAAQC